LETIIVKRYEVITGSDGNPALGDLNVWKSFDNALFAPDQNLEPALVARDAVITSGNLYIRQPTPAGILDSDVIVVRGEDLAVDGGPEEWSNSRGAHIGDVMHVRAATG
jgi:hypothetical protein